MEWQVCIWTGVSSSHHDYVELTLAYRNVNKERWRTWWWLCLSQAILSRPLYKLVWGSLKLAPICCQSQCTWLNIDWIFASGNLLQCLPNSLLVIVWVVYSPLPSLYVDVSLACTNGDIRLVGGASNLEGRVEICVRDTWGTVCDDSWNAVDASVACGQLGFSRSGQ